MTGNNSITDQGEKASPTAQSQGPLPPPSTKNDGTATTNDNNNDVGTTTTTATTTTANTTTNINSTITTAATTTANKQQQEELLKETGPSSSSSSPIEKTEGTNDNNYVNTKSSINDDGQQQQQQPSQHVTSAALASSSSSKSEAQQEVATTSNIKDEEDGGGPHENQHHHVINNVINETENQPSSQNESKNISVGAAATTTEPATTAVNADATSDQAKITNLLPNTYVPHQAKEESNTTLGNNNDNDNNEEKMNEENTLVAQKEERIDPTELKQSEMDEAVAAAATAAAVEAIAMDSVDAAVAAATAVADSAAVAAAAAANSNPDDVTMTDATDDAVALAAIQEAASLTMEEEQKNKRKADDAPPSSPDDARPNKKRAAPTRVSWDVRLQQLRNYKKENGNLLIPTRYKLNPSLGKFVHNTREQFKLYHKKTPKGYKKKCSLTAERIQQLDELGFVWSTERTKHQNEDWQSRLQQLKKYKEKHGDCLVPHGYAEDPSFAEWIHRQRTTYATMIKDSKPNEMVKARMDQLKELGFNFTVHSDKWMVHWKQLKEYKETHGDCQVPTHYANNPKLGRWVHTQRHQRRLQQKGKKSCMTPDRIKLLDDLGFSWEVRPSLETPRATWAQRLDELTDHWKKNGNFKVQPQNMPQLHAWCHEQRQRLRSMDKKDGKDTSKRMGPERVEALAKIGFTKDAELDESKPTAPTPSGDDDDDGTETSQKPAAAINAQKKDKNAAEKDDGENDKKPSAQVPMKTETEADNKPPPKTETQQETTISTPNDTKVNEGAGLVII